MILIHEIKIEDLEKMSIEDLLSIGKSLDNGNGLWDPESIVSELGVEAMSKASIVESVKGLLEI